MTNLLDGADFLRESLSAAGRHDPDIARRSPHYAAARVELEAASAKHGRGLTIGRVEDILLDHNLTMAHLIAILAKL